jgi:hypothetical protein
MLSLETEVVYPSLRSSGVDIRDAKLGNRSGVSIVSIFRRRYHVDMVQGLDEFKKSIITEE